MNITGLPVPGFFTERYAQFKNLTPIQEKAITAGLFQGTSLLACAPTASGKTLIASIAIVNTLGKGKSLYIVPLKALAKEKYREFSSLLAGTSYKTIVATSDVDSDSAYLANYDLLVLTSEKLDSLLRHKIGWLAEVKLVVIDEIHLLNDPTRGPTLEIIITLLKQLINPQFIGLSATIGNKEALAQWLQATLIEDDWRPVELKKGIYVDGKVEYY